MKNIFISIIVLLIIVSCTEEYSIKPKYESLDDWNTSITMINNNYHRIEITVDSVPPLYGQRDILYFLLEAKNSNETEFKIYDTTSVSTLIWYDTYITPPVFERNGNYDIRLNWIFEDGEDRTTNTINFTAKKYTGEVLVQIEYPETESCIDGRPSYYFFEDELYCFSCSRELTKYDNSAQQFILNDNTEPYYHSDYVFQSDNIIIHGNESDEIYFTYLNPETGVIDSTIQVDFVNFHSNRYFRDLFIHKNYLYVVRDFNYLDSTEVLQVDPQTREILNAYQLDDEFRYVDFSSDNESIWILYDNETYFDHRIARFDLENNTIISPEYCVPVYSAETLKWDGEHFWVQSFYDRKFIKFEYGEME